MVSPGKHSVYKLFLLAECERPVCYDDVEKPLGKCACQGTVQPAICQLVCTRENTASGETKAARVPGVICGNGVLSGDHNIHGTHFRLDHKRRNCQCQRFQQLHWVKQLPPSCPFDPVICREKGRPYWCGHPTVGRTGQENAGEPFHPQIPDIRHKSQWCKCSCLTCEIWMKPLA